MGTSRFTPEFKEEAVRQITERGYSIAEVSERLGVSAHSLYKWLRAVKPDNSGEHEKPRGSHRMMPSTGVKITTIIS